MIKKPKNPNRIARVNALIKDELGPILHEFLSEEKGLVTVSKVETSRDLKWAKVWISILGGNDERILAHLQKNIYQIQGELNKHFFTKIIPRVSFHLDIGSRYAQQIEEIIKKIHEEDETTKA